MSPNSPPKSFWNLLEAVGLPGTSAHSWRLVLGENWSNYPLRNSKEIASAILDPLGETTPPRRWLEVSEMSPGCFVAMSDCQPPRVIELCREDVEMWCLDWMKAARLLAGEMRFTATTPAREGSTRLIGTLHPPKKAVSGAYLHIPLAISARRAHLLAEMARLPDGCTLTLPSNSMVNDEVTAMAHARNITLDFIAQRTADGNPGSMHLRARSARSIKAGSAKEPEPILDVAPDWKWERLRLQIDVSGLLYAEYGREKGRAQLPKSTARRESVPTKILLLLAAHKQWKNPPRDHCDYDATARAFNRLRALLKALVPIHGEPFERMAGKFVPKFQIEFTEATAEAAQGLERSQEEMGDKGAFASQSDRF